MNKKTVRLIKSGICVIGVGAIFAAAYQMGKHDGVQEFVDKLILNCEFGEGENPVFSTKFNGLSTFIYEIKAECIGD